MAELKRVSRHFAKFCPGSRGPDLERGGETKDRREGGGGENGQVPASEGRGGGHTLSQCGRVYTHTAPPHPPSLSFPPLAILALCPWSLFLSIGLSPETQDREKVAKSGRVEFSLLMN